MHFRFNGGHLGFPLPFTSGSIETSSTELLDLDNVGVAVEMSLLS